MDAKEPVPAADQPQQSGERPQVTWQEGSAEGAGGHAQWIVRFNSYRMAADHEASIAAHLGALSPELNTSAAGTGTCPGSSCSAGRNPSCCGGGGGSGGKCAALQPWHWVRRRNKAAAHPTDFGLLSCAPTVADIVKVRSPRRLHCDPEEALPITACLSHTRSVVARNCATVQLEIQELLCILPRSPVPRQFESPTPTWLSVLFLDRPPHTAASNNSKQSELHSTSGACVACVAMKSLRGRRRGGMRDGYQISNFQAFTREILTASDHRPIPPEFASLYGH